MSNAHLQCLDNSMVREAYDYAVTAHGEQKRKYTGEPYVVHPLSVAETIWRLGHGPYVTMTIGAMLHDVVEDCPGYTLDMIEKKFGQNVRQIVDDLTKREYPVEWTRKMRKAAETERLRNVQGISQTIKLADLIDNTMSIVPYDPTFAKVYLEEKLELLLAMKSAHPLLAKLAWDQLDAAFTQLEMNDERSKSFQ
jgi:(p)ppGpp synthase/HD superfamily hydrolase